MKIFFSQLQMVYRCEDCWILSNIKESGIWGLGVLYYVGKDDKGGCDGFQLVVSGDDIGLFQKKVFCRIYNSKKEISSLDFSNLED